MKGDVVSSEIIPEHIIITRSDGKSFVYKTNGRRYINMDGTTSDDMVVWYPAEEADHDAENKT